MKNIDKLSKWLSTTPYDVLVLNRRDSFKWITEGDDNAVVTNIDTGVAYIVLYKNDSAKNIILSDSSDALRIKAEQNSLNLEVFEIPWYEDLHEYVKSFCLKHKNMGLSCASDVALAHTTLIFDSLVDLRMQLSPKEIATYRELGNDCATIIETIATNAQIGESELSIAKRIRNECFKKNISPDCVIVGADERILKYRHPMPTNNTIQQSLMVVLGGERSGLNVSITRMVYFKTPPNEIIDRMEATQFVFAMAQQLMKENLPYNEYFAELKKAYSDVGYPDEWKMHHQGGPTGYSCREFIINEYSDKRIKNNQAYAWNPTINGTKCEETTILQNDQVEILTKTSAWPRKNVITPLGPIDVASILVQK